MRIKTLVILSIVMIVLGSGLGAGYAYISVSGQPLQLPDIIPTPESVEEGMINDFIEQQEQLRPNGMDDIVISSNDEKENDKKENDKNNDKNKSNDKNNAKNEDEDKDEDKDKEANKPVTEEPLETLPEEPDDDGSWIKLNQGEQIGQPTVRDGIALNVRSGPSQDDKVIAKVYNADKIILLEKDNGWYHVITRSGVEGYASAEYVKVVK